MNIVIVFVEFLQIVNIIIILNQLIRNLNKSYFHIQTSMTFE